MLIRLKWEKVMIQEKGRRIVFEEIRRDRIQCINIGLYWISVLFVKFNVKEKVECISQRLGVEKDGEGSLCKLFLFFYVFLVKWK